MDARFGRQTVVVFFINNRDFILVFKGESSCSDGPGLFEYGGNFP